MKVTSQALLLVAWSFLVAGCGAQQERNANAAIQQAIEQHLADRPNLAKEKLVMEMKQVQVQGERAEAEVVFHSQSDARAQMTFHYQLHKEGRQWKVESGRPSASGSPHPSPDSPANTEALPEGHPSVPPPSTKQ